MSHDDTISIQLYVHLDRPMSWLVEPFDAEFQTKKFFLPKSIGKQGDKVEGVTGRLTVYLFEVPEWFLLKEGVL